MAHSAAPSPSQKASRSASAVGDDIELHVQHDHGTGGHWCAKIVFFALMAILVGLVGLIVLENRGNSDRTHSSANMCAMLAITVLSLRTVDTPLSESRFADYLEGWVDEVREDDHHDDQHSVLESLHELDEHEHDDEPFSEEEVAEDDDNGDDDEHGDGHDDDDGDDDEGEGEEEEEGEEDDDAENDDDDASEEPEVEASDEAAAADDEDDNADDDDDNAASLEGDQPDDEDDEDNDDNGKDDEDNNDNTEEADEDDDADGKDVSTPASLENSKLSADDGDDDDGDDDNDPFDEVCKHNGLLPCIPFGVWRFPQNISPLYEKNLFFTQSILTITIHTDFVFVCVLLPNCAAVGSVHKLHRIVPLVRPH